MGNVRYYARVVKVVAVSLQAVALLLVLIAFFVPWYHYSLNGVQGWESIHGRRIESPQKNSDTPSSLAWVDADSPHLHVLYVMAMLILIAAFILGFLVLSILILANTGRFLSTKTKMMLRFLKKKVKKVAVILSMLEFILLGSAAILFGSQHAGTFSKDWSKENNGECQLSICTAFRGPDFGPAAGWYLLCVASCLCFLLVLVVFVYALDITKKFMKYERVSSW